MIRPFGSIETRIPLESWLRRSAYLLPALPLLLALGACGEDPATDASDACPNDDAKTEPGVCGCGVADLDADENGTVDCLDGAKDDDDEKDKVVDACPDDDTKTEPGACGCGVPESSVDLDEDGVLDCVDDDTCPGDDTKTEPGLCGCGVPDLTDVVGERQITYCETRRLFMTQASNGRLGGIAGADTRCNTAPDRPLSPPGTFKAMVGAVGRTPCVPGTAACDWVFKPGVRYVRASDGETVAVADASALLPFPLLGSFHAYWSGEIYSGFSVSEDGSAWVLGRNCHDWTFSEVSQQTSVGISNLRDGRALADYNQFCDRTATILCVEQ